MYGIMTYLKTMRIVSHLLHFGFNWLSQCQKLANFQNLHNVQLYFLLMLSSVGVFLDLKFVSLFTSSLTIPGFPDQLTPWYFQNTGDGPFSSILFESAVVHSVDFSQPMCYGRVSQIICCINFNNIDKRRQFLSMYIFFKLYVPTVWPFHQKKQIKKIYFL